MMYQLARPTATAPPQAAAATAAAAPSQVTPIVRSGSKLAPPAQFMGEQGLCKTFIIDCSIHFELTPHAFPTDRSKIAFMISHLSGRAKAWAEWARNSPLCGLRQGSASVYDDAIRFRTLVAVSWWNDKALYDMFLKGLASSIQDLLVPLDLPADPDSLITLAIQTDNRIGQLQRQRGRGPAVAEEPSPPHSLSWPASDQSSLEQHRHVSTEGELMQLDRSRRSDGDDS